MVLRVPSGPNAGLHALDAKFRLRKEALASLEHDDGAPGSTYKAADLHKMHTYRDALSAVRTAWVLYPGDVFRFFDQKGTVARATVELPQPMRGVGVARLAPGPSPGTGSTLPKALFNR